MPWYDFLKSIFPNLKSIVHLDFSKRTNVHITNTNVGNKYKYEDSSKRLTISLPNLTPEEEKGIQKILTTALDENVILLQDKSKTRIEDFKSAEKSEETQKIIDFLRPLISSSDIIIWRAALYLKKHFTEGGKGIPRLKTDISQRYGNRGKNIANLCTADYLEDYLIPVHNVLLKSGSDTEKVKEKFRIIYDNIVENLPFTIFVCHKMREDEIENTIVAKMEQNLKYGLKFLNIHGIGKNNIGKIKETITKIEDKPGFANKNITEENNIIFVRLEFK